MDNVLCTPHLGYVERDQLDRYFADQFARVLAFERGAPVDAVNPEALKEKP
jgi:D-3-phosphoglycerate dehydrogenase